MRFDLTTLRLFVAAVEEKSLAKAADREHLVPSAVSRRITDLEEQLGMLLLVRLRDGVKPTLAGEELVRHIREVTNLLDRIPRELLRAVGEDTEPVRVAANAAATVGYLVYDLKSYLVAHPDARVRLEERQSLAIIDAVEEGLLDFGVVGHYSPADRLRVIPYRKVPLWLAVLPEHPLASRESITFVEVLDFDLITLMQGSAMHGMALDAAASTRRKTKLPVQVSTYEAMRKMVQHDFGIAVFPEPNLLPYKDLLGLRCIPLTDNWASMQLNLVLPKKDLALEAQALVDFLTAT
jgi:DNA-binding transcriptional LysR family regulator